MGYRSRLGCVSKCEKDRFSGLGYEDAIIENGGDDYSLYYPPFHEELYELGKYFSFLDEKYISSFYDFDIEKETECEFYILSKEGLKEIIENYRKCIFESYNNLFNIYNNIINNKEDISFENPDVSDIGCYFSEKMREWNNEFCRPYWLDEKKSDGNIVKSWRSEYAIFNLVDIYRTFDWDNDYLIYSAW